MKEGTVDLSKYAKDFKAMIEGMEGLEMRDIHRIERILTKIGILWGKTPDQRFFQLLFNYTRLGTRAGLGKVQDPFHYKDDELEKHLDKLLGRDE